MVTVHQAPRQGGGDGRKGTRKAAGLTLRACMALISLLLLAVLAVYAFLLAHLTAVDRGGGGGLPAARGAGPPVHLAAHGTGRDRERSGPDGRDGAAVAAAGGASDSVAAIVEGIELLRRQEADIERRLARIEGDHKALLDAMALGQGVNRRQLPEARGDGSLAADQSWNKQLAHAVFIGDSLLRYSFLEWLDHLLFAGGDGGRRAPAELINEKLASSWTDYFRSSTAHFGGGMSCDCRRSQNFSLGSETENRYYRGGGLRATYLQGYGDNQAHGRYLPDEATAAEVSPETDSTRYKWGFVGRDWDRLLSEHVAKFGERPTLVVLNAGLWPNEGIANNMGSILRSARESTGPLGRVVWRGITPQRGRLANPSSADLAAREWSYRLPWLSYQPFPSELAMNLTESDYFDQNHFSNPTVYRRWNEGITLNPTPAHRVFILVGGVRTLRHTEKSLLVNLILPVCSPPECIAHVVLHFSRADNRPSVGGNDPGGEVVQQSGEGAGGHGEFFSDVSEYFPEGYFVVHRVDGYEIGSPEEQAAMDALESEVADPNVAGRMRLFRRGDPRRYSMWFARAYAWRYFTSLKSAGDFDFFVFCRPDLLWMMPVPTKAFFDDHTVANKMNAWVHSTYYEDVPDTFAMLPDYASAETYFSLSALMKEGVACLGGPNFNKTLVKMRLSRDKTVNTKDSDWCQNELVGWSEKILRRKLRKSQVEINYLHAAAAILRPTHADCQAVAPVRLSGYAKIPNTHVPMFACLMMAHGMTSGRNASSIVGLQPQTLRGTNRNTWRQCLSWNDTSSAMTPLECKFPHPPEQLLFRDADKQWFRYSSPIKKVYEIIPLNESKIDPFLESGQFKAENAEIYSTISHRALL